MKLTVVIAAGPADPVLCGRAGADWLLDTVVALRPDALGFTGGGAAALRERALARPALRQALAEAGQPDVTLVLSARHPLLRPALLRRALRAGSAVLVSAPATAPWWADEARPAGVAAVAYPGCAQDCPPWLTGLEPADARSFRRGLADLGGPVTVLPAGPVESLRADDPVELALAQVALYQRIAARWQRRGVLVDDPATTRIDAAARIGRGATIRPHTELLGATVVGAGASVGPVTTLRDARVGARSVIRYAVCERVTIGADANVGPFTWLRSGTRLGDGTRAGAFVEVADSVVGDGTQIPHVAGLLSADVGAGCNIAGLSGTAIFDGKSRHRVRIGDRVSIGAANVLVGPLSVGDGAYTAAGSVLTRDVPGGALGIARTRQHNVDGWVAAAGLEAP